MATVVIMPRQGQSVESCVITEWVKKVGDKVSVGDTLFSYETDKSSFEEAAQVEGTLLAVFCEDGTTYLVLIRYALSARRAKISPHLYPRRRRRHRSQQHLPLRHRSQQQLPQ